MGGSNTVPTLTSASMDVDGDLTAYKKRLEAMASETAGETADAMLLAMEQGYRAGKESFVNSALPKRKR